jgi:hypothetical protein
MTSDQTRHTATAWPVPDEPTLWSVPGLGGGGAPGAIVGRCGPVPNQAGEAGSEPPVEARVSALDGSERKLLLDELARTYPDVVEAGFELLAQWRAGAAEGRRKKQRRLEHNRRRRRRVAELGGGG